jgi:hypothetical protein
MSRMLPHDSESIQTNHRFIAGALASPPIEMRERQLAWLMQSLTSTAQ